jgi:hypothetical protein
MGLYFKNIRTFINIPIKKHLLPTGLLVNLVLGFIMNVFINAGIGAGMLFINGLQPIPLWGPLSISGDLIGMSFTLTFLVSWFNIDTAREEIKQDPSKHIQRPRLLLKMYCILLPRKRIIRVMFLSILFTLLCLPFIWGLQAHGKIMMPGFEFILFKSLYSGVLATLVILASSYSVYLKKN